MGVETASGECSGLCECADFLPAISASLSTSFTFLAFISDRYGQTHRHHVHWYQSSQPLQTAPLPLVQTPVELCASRPQSQMLCLSGSSMKRKPVPDNHYQSGQQDYLIPDHAYGRARNGEE